MERKDFIKLSALFGIGLSTNQVFGNLKLDKKQKVIIVGAGAGGMAAGYFLKQLGIDFQILEASVSYGGRMKQTTEFTDFPIPLGAEWIHAKKDIFSRILDNPEVNMKTSAYGKDAKYGFWSNDELYEGNMRDKDLKFVGATWFGFFQKYILNAVKNNIQTRCIVEHINYNGEKVAVTYSDEFGDKMTVEADKVIIAVPLNMLKKKRIIFTPTLPSYKQEAIQKVRIWEGFKAFFEFKEKFYHTALEIKIKPKTDGQHLFYDAAYGQNSSKNIMGLFAVGKPAADYSLLNDVEFKRLVLSELDTIYKGQATLHYVKHITQNWNKEQFIEGAYATDHESWRVMRELGKPVGDAVFFAGSEYGNGENWSNVHTAALSAKRCVKEMFC